MPASLRPYLSGDRDGGAQLQVRLEGRAVWLTQRLLAEWHQVSVKTINEHLINIYGEGELDRGATTRNFRIVQREGARDVVVCGPSLRDNREQAKKIEHAANGNYKLCPPHASAGRGALPHCPPDPRGPAGHCFYETSQRKAKQTS